MQHHYKTEKIKGIRKNPYPHSYGSKCINFSVQGHRWAGGTPLGMKLTICLQGIFWHMAPLTGHNIQNFLKTFPQPGCVFKGRVYLSNG